MTVSNVSRTDDLMGRVVFGKSFEPMRERKI